MLKAVMFCLLFLAVAAIITFAVKMLDVKFPKIIDKILKNPIYKCK